MKKFDAEGIYILAAACVLLCKDSYSMSLWEEMIANCKLTANRFPCGDYNISDTAKIPGFPDSAIGSLVLNLELNRIASLKAGLFDSLPSLEELYLGNNQLKNLSVGLFDTLVNLKVLDLSGNVLTTLETGLFAYLSRLIELDLSGNVLTTLETGLFDYLSWLATLFIDSNLITSLGTGLFDAMSAVAVISLGHNRIEVLEPGLFNNLANLHYLNLTDNRLKTLTSGIFDSLSNLKILYLPIVCDCIESKSLSSWNNSALDIVGENSAFVTAEWKSATAGCNGTWIELPYCEQFMTTGTEGVASSVPITNEMSTSVLTNKKSATLTATTEGMIYTGIAAVAGSIASAVIILNVSSKIFKAIEKIKTLSSNQQTVTPEQIEDTVVDIFTPEYEFSWKPTYAGCRNTPPMCHEGIIF